MALCNNCGATVKDGTKFCGECGKKIEPEQKKPTTESKSNNSRKIKYEGEINKCPNCGAVLKSFIEKCPDCGYELRGAIAVESVSDFARCYADAKTNEQKVSLIRTFVIPNTKEDILEFAILASSNIDEDSWSNEDSGDSEGMSKQDVAKAWEAKFEQAYQKAQLLLAGSPELVSLEKLYKQKSEHLKTSKKIGNFKKSSKVIIIVTLVVLCILFTTIGYVVQGPLIFLMGFGPMFGFFAIVYWISTVKL